MFALMTLFQFMVAIIVGMGMGGCQKKKEAPAAQTKAASDPSLLQQSIDYFQSFAKERNAEALSQAWGPLLISKVTEGEVLLRRHGSDTWEPLIRGMHVSELDEIKTLNGSAVLRYAKGTELTIEPGSLVILRASRSDAEGKHRVAELTILSGHIKSRVASNGEAEITLRILGPKGMVRLSSQGGTRIALIRIKRKGGMVVDAQMGSLRMVTRQGAIDVAKGERGIVSNIGEVRIKRPPALRSPKSITANPLIIAKGQHDARLAWQSPARIVRYEIQVARDKKFSRYLLRKRTKRDNFDLSNQNEPVMYWRVRGFTNSGRQTPFSTPQQVQFTDAHQRPMGRFFGSQKSRRIANGRTTGAAILKLKVSSPNNNAVIQSSQFEVRGSVAQGARVLVNNIDADVDTDGGWQIIFEAKEGINQIVVEARKPDGSIAHNIRNVFFKP